MKVKRIVSAFLTTVMFLGSLVVPAEAAYADKVDEDGVPLIDYLNTNYETPEDKLADMLMVKE